jgi:hypothetical protein
MSDDIDFLGGPFPRSPTAQGPNDSLPPSPTPMMARGASLPPPPQLPPSFVEQPSNILGAPPGTSLRYSSNLDDPLPLPYGYEPPSFMNEGPNGGYGAPPYGAPPSGATMLPYNAKKFGNPSYMSMSCIDIANHLTACPVCSKLHKSHSPIFIGVIVFLIIVIFFLGRKFFD